VLNHAIREYAKSNLNVAEDASDDAIKTAVQEALQSGKLTGEKYAELLAKKDTEPKSMKDELVQSIGARFDASMEKLAALLKPSTEEPAETPVADDFDAGKMAELLESRVKESVDKVLQDINKPSEPKKHDGPSAWDVFGEHAEKHPQGASDDVNVRVKAAVERYDDTKYPAKYQKGIFKGEPIKRHETGVQLNDPSKRDLMMIGSWFKYTYAPWTLTEHEKEVVSYILENEDFIIASDSKDTRRLNETERMESKAFYGRLQKAPLIDDGTSGGANAVPEFFDTNVAILPILGGQVSPFVNMIDVPRGSSADSYTISNPTYTSNAVEGSAVNLFDATSMIAALDTTFFRAHAGIEVGKNFLQDSAPNVAQILISRFGAAAAAWLDEQLTNGDGSTEPTGIKNASGTTDVTAGTPTTGPLTITDVLNMAFGVSMAYRNNGAGSMRQLAYIMTENTYKNLRSIATGVTGDTRLIFGDDIFSYKLFNLPVAIEENGMSNNDFIFGQFGGYRLYRRQGVRFVMEDRGQELVTSNSMLIYSDMRYGGKPERGGYFAVMDSAPSS